MSFKKIRGWKRRLRQLEKWKNDSIPLDLDLLRDYQVEYRKIFNLDNSYFIPNWFKSKVVLSFIDILKHWEIQAQGELKAFDIRLHIDESNIFDSQIMIVISSAIEDYRNKFEIVEGNLERPDWIINVENREWIPFYSYSVWLKDEIDSLTDEDKSKLIKNLVKVNNEYNSEEEQEYIVPDSIFWCLVTEYKQD
ncbi:hypothetical protein SH601_06860 [Gracilibacillus sp. S3-1-1]|uniref:Uncharacterized protein n=1 Tax=Gracilibacillus pellucidus TaxID=3095368 RepID=A0ACC6M4F1_9BACI|nr:hypothetical protein [Gracilibacillus sp. S3-1-1]MDX8045707.1 hypothetical protein [Gracilibacillus sp. S3-1-1]